jgi:hypothetical protein
VQAIAEDIFHLRKVLVEAKRQQATPLGRFGLRGAAPSSAQPIGWKALEA